MNAIENLKRKLVIIDNGIEVMNEVKTVKECVELADLAEQKGMQVKILNI